MPELKATVMIPARVLPDRVTLAQFTPTIQCQAMMFH